MYVFNIRGIPSSGREKLQNFNSLDIPILKFTFYSINTRIINFIQVFCTKMKLNR